MCEGWEGCEGKGKEERRRGEVGREGRGEAKVKEDGWEWRWCGGDGWPGRFLPWLLSSTPPCMGAASTTTRSATTRSAEVGTEEGGVLLPPRNVQDAGTRQGGAEPRRPSFRPSPLYDSLPRYVHRTGDKSGMQRRWEWRRTSDATRSDFAASPLWRERPPSTRTAFRCARRTRASSSPK